MAIIIAAVILIGILIYLGMIYTKESSSNFPDFGNIPYRDTNIQRTLANKAKITSEHKKKKSKNSKSYYNSGSPGYIDHSVNNDVSPIIYQASSDTFSGFGGGSSGGGGASGDFGGDSSSGHSSSCSSSSCSSSSCGSSCGGGCSS